MSFLIQEHSRAESKLQDALVHEKGNGKLPKSQHGNVTQFNVNTLEKLKTLSYGVANTGRVVLLQ